MATRKKGDTISELEAKPPAASIDGADAIPAQPSDRTVQMEALERGVRLFREERFAEAAPWLERAANGPLPPVARTAKNYFSVAQRRLNKPSLNLVTGEDHYNYAIERMNARDLPTARKHLEVALALQPSTDYILYAFAAVLALSGDIAGSYENLKRAIEVDPRNRSSARHDPDFYGVAHHALFAQLLHPERSHPF